MSGVGTAAECLRAGGKRVIIRDFALILDAIAGETGTRTEP